MSDELTLHAKAVRPTLAVPVAPAAGLAAAGTLLAVLAATVGLGATGWAAGLACAVVVDAVVVAGVRASGARALGPADLVTFSRAVLACGVAALVADSYLRPPAVGALVLLTAVALVLDSVDGRIARRTRTESTFGALFDGEVDAFLILVLSVYVAQAVGPWVLAIGAARYAFALAGWVRPWMRGRLLPARPWRKVVAAVQGIVLVFAVADLVPRPATITALAIALALLAESFGRDVWWLWSRHAAGRSRPV